MKNKTKPETKPETQSINLNLITDKQIENAGYDIYINRGDYFIAVAPMTFGKGRIIYCESVEWIDNGWCYTSEIKAMLAMIQWDIEKTQEPKGWFRNPIDGRRRPNGDKSKEYISR